VIEEGIALLVQGAPAVSEIAVSGGGFLATIPKDLSLPSWTQQCISEPVDYTLDGTIGINDRHMQIDCYAEDPDQCLELAAAIDTVLSGYRGTLADADAITVYGCFRINQIDIFDPSSRSFRRVLEYKILYTKAESAT
jgi:hypothetical protein